MVWLNKHKWQIQLFGMRSQNTTFSFCAKLYSVLLNYPNCSFGENKDMLECMCSATFFWNIMFTVKKKMPNSVLSQENSLLGSKLWLNHHSLILPKDKFFFFNNWTKDNILGWPKSWFRFFLKTLMGSSFPGTSCRISWMYPWLVSHYFWINEIHITYGLGGSFSKLIFGQSS